MTVLQVSSASEYAEQKQNAKSRLGTIVHFSASWCEPCKAVASALESASAALGDAVTIMEVNAEVHGDICEAEDVASVPYIVFFRTSLHDGSQEKVAVVSGAKLDQIEMNIKSLFGNGKDGKSSFPTVEDYYKHLISQDKLVAFITGSPSMPHCGFTGRLCQLLEKLGAKFTYYDVMADDQVCEGMKKFSNWPTFPQVYVDGELIGGYDICMELNEEGELKSTLHIE